MRITKQTIDRATFPFDDNRRFVLWDDDLPGFGLRIYPSGKKAFVLSYRSKGRKRLLSLGSYGFLTVDQAKREARIKLGLVSQGFDPLADKQRLSQMGTVKELCETYLDRHAKIHKKTWREDERRIRKHLIPALGAHKVASLSPMDVSQVHSAIGKRSIYEANRTMEVLRSAIEKGKFWGFIESHALNPASRIQRFKEKKRDRWLTPVELPRVAIAIAEEENIYVRSAIWLYLLTGIRKSELLKATWADINWERRELRLLDTKAGNCHYVPMSSAAMTILSRIPRLADNPFIIPGKKPGARMIGITRPWIRIRNRAKVTDVRLHDLRRTVGSWLAQEGASLHLIGRVLNHASSETTRVYARFGQDHVRTALEDHGQRMLDASLRSSDSQCHPTSDEFDSLRPGSHTMS